MASENESEKRETLAEVLAEMRAEAARADMEQFYTLDDAAESMREYADRITAAWRHEKAEIEANALAVGGIVEAARHSPGNAAAMREALITIRQQLQTLDEYGNIAKEAYLTILGWIDAALSEPARNCDRFADELDAQLAFLNEVWLISIDRETMFEQDEYQNWTDEMRTRYGRWLLAPAAERKGDGDENK